MTKQYEPKAVQELLAAAKSAAGYLYANPGDKLAAKLWRSLEKAIQKVEDSA